MKVFLYVLMLTVCAPKVSAQNCISLGCARSLTGITTDGALPDTLITAGLGCYNGNALKQIFWEFFYSPGVADFTQTYTPTSGTNLAINYVIFDIGLTAPVSFGCPVNTTGWTPGTCGITDHQNQPVGPGLFGITSTTIAGHYYAVAIIIWQGTSNGADASYTFNISTPQLDLVDFTPANCPGVLPVRISSFTGKVNNCTANLDWVAESQANIKNYEVQSSTDGTGFQTISLIAGTDVPIAQKYTYQDKRLDNGNVYYRLKMTGFDGKSDYSAIIKLRVNCSLTSGLVYPNPVTDILNINIAGELNGIMIASLFNTEGQLLYSSKIVTGANTINMQKFARGIYTLRLTNNVKTQTVKIIK